MKQRLVLILFSTLAVSCSGSGSPAAPTLAPTPQMYSGPVSTQMIVRLTIVPTTSATNVCEFLRVFSGTLSITLTQASDGTVTGTASMTGTEWSTRVPQSTQYSQRGNTESISSTVLWIIRDTRC